MNRDVVDVLMMGEGYLNMDNAAQTEPKDFSFISASSLNISTFYM